MKTAILGASRGLGKALVETASSGSKLWLSSRTIEHVGFETKAEICAKVSADFSKSDQSLSWLGALQIFQPEQVIYCAGGGPYGVYGERKWMAHHWCLNVTLLGAMQLVHWAIQQQQRPQVIAIGSSIAESSADPFASSYAAAKHGLKGFHASITKENEDFDFRLFSPGYMDTDLLPKNSPPRNAGKPLWDPQEVSRKIWSWSVQSKEFQAHSVLSDSRN